MTCAELFVLIVLSPEIGRRCFKACILFILVTFLFRMNLTSGDLVS